MDLTLVGNIFYLVGGLGLFLYGIHIMSEGLQKSTGSKLSYYLGKATDNRLMGVLVGALITAIIHSSSAVTVMVVGLVNAGMMNLMQATGVIMGANIGTTVTSWFVSLVQIDLGDTMEIFSPSFFAPLLLGVGAYMLLFQSKKDNLLGEVLTGIGMLFVGLNMMFEGVEPYTELPIFGEIFRVLGGNPILGILAGAVITAIIQSSTASVTILQSLAMGGMVTKAAAVYITLGQNIGTCATALISSAGTNTTAKRAANIHILFNVIGAVIFGVLMFIVQLFMPDFANSPMSVVDISLFHTVYNILSTVIMYPMANELVKLSGMMRRDTETREQDVKNYQGDAKEMQKRLDLRILGSTPAIAIQSADDELIVMGEKAESQVRLAIEAILEGNKEKAAKVEYEEETVDQMASILTDFLIQVNGLQLSEKQKLHVNNMFYTISDFERVGDHADNLAGFADYVVNNGIVFSETGVRDIKRAAETAIDTFALAVESKRSGSLEAVKECRSDEDEMDTINDELREKHIERLSRGECEPQAGVIFLDILTNLERVGDHAVNVAGYVRDENT